MSATRIIMIAVVLCAVLAPAASRANHLTVIEENGLRYVLTTPQDTCAIWGSVSVSLIVVNISDQAMPIEHPCVGLGGLSFTVWAPGTPPGGDPREIWGCCACFAQPWVEFLPAGGGYSKTVHWDMYDSETGLPIDVAGTYVLEGNVTLFLSPGGENLCQQLTLEIEILPGPTTVPEWCGSWGTIKALYRCLGPAG